jgi:outer membrane receptor protein involved in Fe transport
MNQYTANVRDKNRFASLSLTYKLDGEGKYRLSPMASFTQLARPDGRGISISPSTSRSANDRMEGINFDDLSPMDVNLSAGGRNDQQFLAGADFTAAPKAALRFNAGYRYLNYDSDVNQFSPDAATLAQANPADPKSWTVQRRQSRSIMERWSHSFDVNGSYDYRPEAVTWWKNFTQVGVNGRWNGNDRSASATGPRQSAINIYTGLASSSLKNDTLPLTEAVLTSAFAFNAYAQDQISLDNGRWVATLGLGYAQETPDRDYRPTNINPDTVRDLKDATSTKYGEPTPNAALLFNATRSLAVYVSYATSYALAPVERENKAGESGMFDPERGDSYEAGLKYDLPSLAASVNLALFGMERFNVMTQSAANDLNPNGLRYYTQKDGEGVISRGLELSGEARPLRNWRVNAGAAYLSAEYQSDIDKVSNGAPADKSPEWSGNLFTRYDVANGPARGLGASLGAVYQGERLSAIRTTLAPDPLVLPYFVRLDAGLYYRVNGSIDFALNVENLNDDRRIALDGATGTSIELGAPRRVSFRTGYRL